jgi:hypothetical protein
VCAGAVTAAAVAAAGGDEAVHRCTRTKSAAACARPNRLLPVRDPSARSTLGDEAVHRCCGVYSASEHGTWPSPRRSSLGSREVVFAKLASKRREEDGRYTCPKKQSPNPRIPSKHPRILENYNTCAQNLENIKDYFFI